MASALARPAMIAARPVEGDVADLALAVGTPAAQVAEAPSARVADVPSAQAAAAPLVEVVDWPFGMCPWETDAKVLQRVVAMALRWLALLVHLLGRQRELDRGLAGICLGLRAAFSGLPWACRHPWTSCDQRRPSLLGSLRGGLDYSKQVDFSLCKHFQA